MVKDLDPNKKKLLKSIENKLTTSNVNVLYYGPESSLNQLTDYLNQGVSEEDAINLCKNIIEYRQQVLRRTDEEYEKMKKDLAKSMAIKLIVELVGQEGSFHSMEKELANQKPTSEKGNSVDSKPSHHWLLGNSGNQIFRDSIKQPDNWDFDAWLMRNEEKKNGASQASPPNAKSNLSPKAQTTSKTQATPKAQPTAPKPPASPEGDKATKIVPVVVNFTGSTANLILGKSIDMKTIKKSASESAQAVASAIKSLPKPTPKLGTSASSDSKKPVKKAKSREIVKLDTLFPDTMAEREIEMQPIKNRKAQPWDIDPVFESSKPLPPTVEFPYRAGNVKTHDDFRRLKFLVDKKTKHGLANVAKKSAVQKRLLKFPPMYEFRLYMAKIMNAIIDNGKKDADIERRLVQFALSYANQSMDHDNKYRRESIDNELQKLGIQSSKANEADTILLGLQRLDNRHLECAEGSPLRDGYDNIIKKLESFVVDIRLPLTLIGKDVDFAGFDHYL